MRHDRVLFLVPTSWAERTADLLAPGDRVSAMLRTGCWQDVKVFEEDGTVCDGLEEPGFRIVVRTNDSLHGERSLDMVMDRLELLWRFGIGKVYESFTTANAELARVELVFPVEAE